MAWKYSLYSSEPGVYQVKITEMKRYYTKRLGYYKWKKSNKNKDWVMCENQELKEPIFKGCAKGPISIMVDQRNDYQAISLMLNHEKEALRLIQKEAEEKIKRAEERIRALKNAMESQCGLHCYSR